MGWRYHAGVIPHVLIPGGIEPPLAERLLAYAAALRDEAVAGRVGHNDASEIDQSVRKVLVIEDLGELQPDVEAAVDRVVEDVRVKLGVSPFVQGEKELTLVAYGDGAFYDTHIDTFTGRSGAAPPRQITFVGYFFREPQRFTGGALRLFDLPQAQWVDIEPRNGLLVAFPSWTPHEVLPVSCPDGQFADGRFAVNVWVCGRRAPGKVERS